VLGYTATTDTATTDTETTDTETTDTETRHARQQSEGQKHLRDDGDPSS